jgi:hypothetical protein
VVIARWLRRAWRRYRGQVAGIAALAALAFGVAGYGEQNPQLSTPDRFYAALQLFSMSGDANKPPIPLPLEMARWLAPLTVAYAVFRTLTAIFLRQWTQARIWVFFRRHVIICGLGQAGLRFAIGFHDRGERVAIIDRDPPTAAVEKCSELGIPVLTGDATEGITLACAGVRRARHLIAVCGEDVINAEVALALTASSARRRTPINCLVQLADERLCQLVDQQALTATAIAGPVAYEFFNVYQAGPAALFETHADLLTAREGIPPHLMILGMGRFATALITEAARRWRLDRAHSAGWIRITLVAPDADAQAAALNARYPALATTCELTTCPTDPSDPDGPASLPSAEDPANRPTGALVCLGEDAATFRATLLLRRILPEQCPVIACTTGRSSLAALLDRSASGMLASVEGFSLLDRVCRPEVLLNGRRETLAQAVHDDYVRRRREYGADPDDQALAPWEDLPETLRASSRAQAADLGEKLRTIGCELVPATNWDPPPLPFTATELEHLAVLEHQRWEGERRQDGWRPGPTRDPVRKISPYLVPWENLPEEIKDLDRDAIRALPIFLTRAGFAITRGHTPTPHLAHAAPNDPAVTARPGASRHSSTGSALQQPTDPPPERP